MLRVNRTELKRQRTFRRILPARFFSHVIADGRHRARSLAVILLLDKPQRASSRCGSLACPPERAACPVGMMRRRATNWQLGARELAGFASRGVVSPIAGLPMSWPVNCVA